MGFLYMNGEGGSTYLTDQYSTELYNINQRNANILTNIFIFNFDVFYIFRSRGSSSGRRLCIYSYEGESSGSKHVEDIKKL